MRAMAAATRASSRLPSAAGGPRWRRFRRRGSRGATAAAGAATRTARGARAAGGRPDRRYQPNRVISACQCRSRRAIESRASSPVVAMPCTFSLNSSTFEAQRSASSSVDEPLLVEAEDRLVERLHAVLRRALGDGAVNQVRLLLVDDTVADEGRRRQHLDCRDAALARALGIRRCETTARRTLASCRRICFCWCGGNTAMMRLIVSVASRASRATC